jgi:hypothetical protein
MLRVLRSSRTTSAFFAVRVAAPVAGTTHDLVHRRERAAPAGAALLRAGELLLKAPVADGFAGGDEWPVEELAVGGDGRRLHARVDPGHRVRHGVLCGRGRLVVDEERHEPVAALAADGRRPYPGAGWA